MGDTLEDIAKNIFALLRRVDNYNVDLVVIEGTEKEGLGLAINNRLIRACEYNYIENLDPKHIDIIQKTLYYTKSGIFFCRV